MTEQPDPRLDRPARPAEHTATDERGGKLIRGFENLDRGKRVARGPVRGHSFNSMNREKGPGE